MDESVQSPDTVLGEAAEALFRLGRLFSRIGVPASTPGHAGRAVELSRILVAQAIEGARAHGDREITVGMIAQQLGVDPSTASRLVGEAIKDGYVARSGSAVDSRRAQLDLTEAGTRLAQEARAYQLDVFKQVTRDWSESERSEFARLFVLFSAAVADAVQAESRLPASRNDRSGA